MSKKFCPNCNFEVGDNDNFCQQCGSPLNPSESIGSKKSSKLKSRISNFFEGVVENITEGIKSGGHKLLISNSVRKAGDFLQKIDDYKEGNWIILSNAVIELKNDFKKYYDVLNNEDIESLGLSDESRLNVSSFLRDYPKIDDIVDEINEEIKIRNHRRLVLDNVEKTEGFFQRLNDFKASNDLIPSTRVIGFKDNFKECYSILKKEDIEPLDLSKESRLRVSSFLRNYPKTEEIIKEYNLTHSGEKVGEFVQRLDDFKESKTFIPSTDVIDLKNDFEKYYDVLNDEDIGSLDLTSDSKANVSDFLRDFPKAEGIVDEINGKIKEHNRFIVDNVKGARKFLQKLDDFKRNVEFIPSTVVTELRDNFKEYYDVLKDEDIESLDLAKYFKSNASYFLRDYPKIEEIIKEYNLTHSVKKSKDFTKKIDGFKKSKWFISPEDVIKLKENFKPYYDFLKDEDIESLDLIKQSKSDVSDFLMDYPKIEEIINEYNLIHSVKKSKNFIKKINDFKKSDGFISPEDVIKLKENFKPYYDFLKDEDIESLDLIKQSKSDVSDFLMDYPKTDEIIAEINKEIQEHNRFILNCVEKAGEFVQRLDDFKEREKLIPLAEGISIKKDFKEYYDSLKGENIRYLNLSKQSKANVSAFRRDYLRIEEIIAEINEEIALRILQKKIDANVEKLNQFNIDFDYLIHSNLYITFKQRDELIGSYTDLFDLVNEANEKIELSKEFKEFFKTYPKIESIIESRNGKYVRSELNKYKDFFDDIDGKSLDSNQRLAVVKNELNSQIIAGAGCGKTLTINAKARYLIEKKGVDPADILCLSFSNLSVNDLKESLPEGIEIATFHSLGGNILKENNEVSRPDSDALDNFIKSYFRDNIIHNKKICKEFFEFYSYYPYDNIEDRDVNSLGEVYDIEEARDFTTLRGIYGGDNEKITFNMEKVKSFEELVIANYLFAHQIDYEYEKAYETDNKNFLQHKTFIFDLLFSEFDEIDFSSEIVDFLVDGLCPVFEVDEHIILDRYHPDFYLVDNDIYFEHFGVNRDCEARWLDEEGSKRYGELIKFKRNTHKTYGSKLIETYSYYMSEDRLLSRLEEKLKEEGVKIKDIDYEYMFFKITERKDVSKFNDVIKLIKTFIELFKGNDYPVSKFKEFKKINDSNPRKFDRRRSELFLNVVEDIYKSYQKHLTEIHKIDFNDMINNAAREVEKGNLKSKYRYIFVDEYQDTSYTRYKLVKAIQDKTGAKVCVVGDDWQSIYRFTGCDVSLFTKFEDYFENPEKLKIETTYRNSQKLIDITGNFIRKNPNQIDKRLKSKKESTENPVKIMYYNKKDLKDKIMSMESLVEKISEISDEIMILGRNNFDINDFIDDPKLHKNKDNDYEKYLRFRPFKEVKDPNAKYRKLIYKKNKNLKIKYITVHRSKGLESDNVILINLVNSRSGFPNQIEDDSVMNFVINDSDKFEFGEERRLFYVALTRTKNNVYLLAPDTNKSSFVIELEENIGDLEVLKQDYDLYEDLDDLEEFVKDKGFYSIVTSLKCPVCKTGDVNLIIYKNDSGKIVKFFGCSHRKCDWRGGFYSSDLEFLDEIEFCPECGGVMQVRNSDYGLFYGCSNYPKCKFTKNRR